MARKTIEQMFEHKNNKLTMFIQARNYGGHMLSFSTESGNIGALYGLTTDEMRVIAKQITETAKAIDDDADFATPKP